MYKSRFSDMFLFLVNVPRWFSLPFVLNGEELPHVSAKFFRVHLSHSLPSVWDIAGRGDDSTVGAPLHFSFGIFFLFAVENSAFLG
jgi:hypothetical protein